MRRAEILVLLAGVLLIAVAVLTSIDLSTESPVLDAEAPATQPGAPPSPPDEPPRAVAPEALPGPPRGSETLTFIAHDEAGRDTAATAEVHSYSYDAWQPRDFNWLRRGPGLHAISMFETNMPLRLTIRGPEGACIRRILPHFLHSRELGEVTLGSAIEVESALTLLRSWPPPAWGAFDDSLQSGKEAAFLSAGTWRAISSSDGLLKGEYEVDRNLAAFSAREAPLVRFNVATENEAGRAFRADCTCEWQNADGQWVEAMLRTQSMPFEAEVPQGARVRLRAKAAHVPAPEVIDEFTANAGMKRRLIVTRASDLVVRLTRGGKPAVAAMWVNYSTWFGGRMYSTMDGELRFPLDRPPPRRICEWPENAVGDTVNWTTFEKPPRIKLVFDKLMDGPNEFTAELDGPTGSLDLSQWAASLPEIFGAHGWRHTLLYGALDAHVSLWTTGKLDVPPGSYTLCSWSGNPLRRVATWSFEVKGNEAVIAPKAGKLWPIAVENLKGFHPRLIELWVPQPGGECKVGVLGSTPLLSVNAGSYALCGGETGRVEFSVNEQGQVTSRGIAKPAQPWRESWYALRVTIEQPWARLTDVAFVVGGAMHSLGADAPHVFVQGRGDLERLQVAAKGYTQSLVRHAAGYQDLILKPTTGGALVTLNSVPLTQDACAAIKLKVNGHDQPFRLHQANGKPAILIPWLDPGQNKLEIQAAGWTWEQDVTITAAELSELTLE